MEIPRPLSAAGDRQPDFSSPPAFATGRATNFSGWVLAGWDRREVSRFTPRNAGRPGCEFAQRPRSARTDPRRRRPAHPPARTPTLQTHLSSLPRFAERAAFHDGRYPVLGHLERDGMRNTSRSSSGWSATQSRSGGAVSELARKPNGHAFPNVASRTSVIHPVK